VIATTKMNRPVALLALALSSFIALGGFGCGGATTSSPDSVLHAYANALQEGKSDEAYALLSGSARRSISLDQFRMMVKKNPQDARELGQMLQASPSASEVTATVTTQNGQRLELVLEQGRWKLDASAIDLYTQDTPRHALVGFVRAVDRKRYDVLLRYITDAHRVAFDATSLKAAWEGPDKEEVARVVTQIRAALPNTEVEETGDRAAFNYGGGTVALLKERGAWKIEDFD
jgi:hypothetical protein